MIFDRFTKTYKWFWLLLISSFRFLWVNLLVLIYWLFDVIKCINRLRISIFMGVINWIVLLLCFICLVLLLQLIYSIVNDWVFVLLFIGLDFCTIVYLILHVIFDLHAFRPLSMVFIFIGFSLLFPLLFDRFFFLNLLFGWAKLRQEVAIINFPSLRIYRVFHIDQHIDIIVFLPRTRIIIPHNNLLQGLRVIQQSMQFPVQINMLLLLS